MKLSLAPLALVALGMIGCSSPTEEQASQEGEFKSRGGVTLTAPSDSGLRISLMMLDGVQASTENKRFIKATVFRGEENFGAFCGLRGTATKEADKVIIGCGLSVATVSGDDDESLGFDIVLSRSNGTETVSLADASYSGDGTFLGKEAKILGHDGGPDVALKAAEATNLQKNALLFGRLALEGVRPILDKKVKSEEVDAKVAVHDASFFVESDLSMQVSLNLGATGALHVSLDPVSLLKTPGNLASGLLTDDGIEQRLEAVLPK